MTAIERIIAENRPHGKLCIGFTPDEEIGEGASLFDIPGFGADFAYTVDGGDVGGIEYENFNAASATVTVHGFSVHPGSAKDSMINASNVAMEFHQALPVMARPETPRHPAPSCPRRKCPAILRTRNRAALRRSTAVRKKIGRKFSCSDKIFRRSCAFLHGITINVVSSFAT